MQRRGCSQYCCQVVSGKQVLHLTSLQGSQHATLSVGNRTRPSWGWQCCQTQPASLLAHEHVCHEADVCGPRTVFQCSHDLRKKQHQV